MVDMTIEFAAYHHGFELVEQRQVVQTGSARLGERFGDRKSVTEVVERFREGRIGRRVHDRLAIFGCTEFGGSDGEGTARFEPEIAVEHSHGLVKFPPCRVDVTRSPQGVHQQHAQAFAMRMRFDQRAYLGNEVGRWAGRRSQREQPFMGKEAMRVPARDRRHAPWFLTLARDFAAPCGPCLLELRDRVVDPPVTDAPFDARQPMYEGPGVDRTRPGSERVPARVRLNGFRADNPSQPPDEDLQVLRGGGWWPITPKRVDQLVCRHDLSVGNRESSDQLTLLGCGNRLFHAAYSYEQRAEHQNLDGGCVFDHAILDRVRKVRTLAATPSVYRSFTGIRHGGPCATYAIDHDGGIPVPLPHAVTTAADAEEMLASIARFTRTETPFVAQVAQLVLQATTLDEREAALIGLYRLGLEQQQPYVSDLADEMLCWIERERGSAA